MTFHKHSKILGYSLVEVLVAISVLLIAIIGPMTIAAKGLQNASLAKQQITAFFLAQEGIEAVVKIREDNALQAYIVSSSSEFVTYDVWDVVRALDNLLCTEDTPCGIEIEEDITPFVCADYTCDLYLHEDGRTRYRHDPSGEITPYHREVLLSSDDSRIHVRSIVTWGDTEDKRVELETYIYNIYEN